MARTDFKSFQAKEVGSVIDLLGSKWRVLSCDHQKVYLGFGFGVDEYHIVAEEIEDNETES